MPVQAIRVRQSFVLSLEHGFNCASVVLRQSRLYDSHLKGSHFELLVVHAMVGYARRVGAGIHASLGIQLFVDSPDGNQI